MELEEVIDHILNGDGILFLGAGFSRDAVNVEGNNMPDASELSKLLCGELGVKINNNLAKVSNHYLKSSSVSKEELEQRKLNLVTYIQNLYFTREVKGYHKSIINRPWRRIYTTNYDDVVEKSSKDRIKIFNMNTDTNIILKNPGIVHLNGYCRTVTTDSLDNEFKLTQRSYLSDSFLNSSSYQAFKHDVKNSKVVVFIGVSLDSDLDIQRLILANKGNKEKIVFIDRPLKEGEEVDEIEDSTKLELGIQYKIGAQNFGEMIATQSKSFKKLENKIDWKTFVKIRDDKSYVHKELDETDIWNFLFTGEINDSFIRNNIDNNEYFVQRTKINKIIDEVLNNKFQISVVHSNLGNGKTVALKTLAYKLAESIEVFQFDKLMDNWELEIEEIIKLEGRKVIIIDNYNNNIEVLNKILETIDDNISIIISGRTYIVKNLYYRLTKRIDEEKICEYDLNKLSRTDLNKFAQYLIERRFTPVFKENADTVKDILVKSCGEKLSQILLFLIKSPNIRREIDKKVASVISNEVKKESLLAIIINNTVPLDLSFEDIIELLENYNEISYIERDEDFSEFVDVYNDEIRMKSSVLSSYILESNDFNQELLGVLKRMIDNASRLSPSECEKVRQKLISVSTMRKLLVKNKNYNDNDVDKIILSYYSQFDAYPEYSNNIFFWLQYGMAAVDAKEYMRAQTYFENSFKVAKKVQKGSDFDTYQVDTQYGRFLLERGLNEDVVDSADDLIKSLDYWIKAFVQRPEQYFYISNQFKLIEPFMVKYILSWNSKQKEAIRKRLKYLKNKYSVKNQTKIIDDLNKLELILFNSLVTQ
ncbi:SIR2 family protein [Neobacillus niacini]|uniref:P-loop NTPase n=2 Tax=Neobacillus niacini TaxID=86668 RepID=UPI0007AB54D2|nr:SIR2 family protein [Neobacillus niacini]